MRPGSSSTSFETRTKISRWFLEFTEYIPRPSYQASKLERIVAEASDLIRRTGHFYDRYSETHKNAGGEKNGDEASEKIPGGNSNLLGNDATAGRYQNRGAATGAGQSDRCEGGHRAASAGAAIERSFGANGCSPGDAPPGVFSPQQLPAGGHQPWRGREDSGNFLDRTLEHRHGVGTGPALRELDRACYSLLESNAQLCLRLQGLGLEYAGLTRELMASGAGEVSGDVSGQVFVGCVQAKRIDLLSAKHPKCRGVCGGISVKVVQ